VTLDRQHTGDRTFDYDNDGVAHYGLYATGQTRSATSAAAQIADDLLNGPEATCRCGSGPSACRRRIACLGRGASGRRGSPASGWGWTTALCCRASASR